MRHNSSPTDRADNFERRLRTTRDSELEPEFVSGVTVGEEETPELAENFPLVRQFKQTNMRGRRGKRESNKGGAQDE